MSRKLIYSYVNNLINIVNESFNDKIIAIIIAQYVSDFVSTFTESKPIIYPLISSKIDYIWMKNIKSQKYHILLSICRLSNIYYIKFIRYVVHKSSYWQFEFKNDGTLISELLINNKKTKITVNHNISIWDIENFGCNELPIIINDCIKLIKYENSVFDDILKLK